MPYENEPWILIITARNVVRQGNVITHVFVSLSNFMGGGSHVNFAHDALGILYWYITALWDRSHGMVEPDPPRSGGGRGPSLPEVVVEEDLPEVVVEEDPPKWWQEEDFPPRQGPDQTSWEVLLGKQAVLLYNRYGFWGLSWC